MSIPHHHEHWVVSLADQRHPRLPVELFHNIIHEAAPVYTPPLHFHHKSYSRYLDYRSERATFCSMALVSSAWREFVQAELFRVLVIFSRSASNIGLASILPKYAARVRTIIVEAPPGKLHDSVSLSEPGLGAIVDNAVRRCFELSTRLDSLEVYGTQFLWWIPYRGTIDDAVPRPNTAPFRSLIWQFASPLVPQDARFCSALIHAGDRLERLEIHDWRLRSHGCRFPKLNLSSVHPRLASLTIIRGDQTAEEVSHLVSRTVSGSGPEREVSINHLSLQGIATLDIHAIMGILRDNNLGRHITSLEIRLVSRFEHRNDTTLFPLYILGLCPSLTYFSYTSPVDDSVFTQLPITLRHLKLLLIAKSGVSRFSPTPDRFIEYIQSPRSRNLHSLQVMVPETSGKLSWAAALVPIYAECERARILFEYNELTELVSEAFLIFL